MNIPEGFEVVPTQAVVLKLEPGDILVLRAPGAISDVVASRLKATVEEHYGLKCMVLGDGLELQILRPAAGHAH